MVFCSNATEALNIAIRGFVLKFHETHNRKPRLVSTMAEHNSVLRPLFHLLKEKLIDLKLAPLTAQNTIAYDALLPLLANCDMAVITAASNVTGNITDFKLVGNACREAGVFLLADASQSAGVEDIPFAEYGVSAVAFTGHKYLLGPVGVGGLVFSGEFPFLPIIQGGTGIHSQSVYQPQKLPLFYEAGTHNSIGIAGLNAALKHRAGADFAAIRDTGVDFAVKLARRLASDPKFKVLGDAYTARRTPAVSFSVVGWSCEDAGHVLWENGGIVCRTGLHCAPLIHKAAGLPEGSVRISFSVYTTEPEYDRLVQLLEKF